MERVTAAELKRGDRIIAGHAPAQVVDVLPYFDGLQVKLERDSGTLARWFFARSCQVWRVKPSPFFRRVAA